MPARRWTGRSGCAASSFIMAKSRWEAPIDIFETDDALTIFVALPGVELDSVSVTLSAGTC